MARALIALAAVLATAFLLGLMMIINKDTESGQSPQGTRNNEGQWHTSQGSASAMAQRTARIATSTKKNTDTLNGKTMLIQTTAWSLGSANGKVTKHQPEKAISAIIPR